jgi:predicted phage-related endonuclease
MENNLKITPAADHISEWSRMFSASENLRSELDFFEDELAFLHKLIDKYFMHLMEDESLHTLNKLSTRLHKTEENRKELELANNQIIRKIGILLENPFSQNEHQIKDSFNVTFSQVHEFQVGLRSLKSEIFEIMEKSLRTEKGRKLLGR